MSQCYKNKLWELTQAAKIINQNIISLNQKLILTKENLQDCQNECKNTNKLIGDLNDRNKCSQ